MTRTASQRDRGRQSVLMAVALDEPAAEACSDVMAQADKIAVSAGTLAETLFVAGRRDIRPAMERLISGPRRQLVPVTEHDAFKAAEVYARWAGMLIPPA